MVVPTKCNKNEGPIVQFYPFFYRKRRLHMTCQHSGYLPCKYCPFGTSDRNSLIVHEQCHHVARLRSKCTFCTYSSKNSLSLANHTNRVHQEQLLKSKSKDVWTVGSSCSTKQEVDNVQEMVVIISYLLFSHYLIFFHGSLDE